MKVAPSQRRHYRGFLLEVLLDFALFVLCALIACRVFVAAKNLSDQAAAVAALEPVVTRAAEDFKVAPGQTSSYQTFYNLRFQKVSAGAGARYCLDCRVSPQQPRGLSTMQITLAQAGQVLQSLQVVAYKPTSDGGKRTHAGN
ncbi:MAG: hypothetical protein LBL67_01330 [Coriobacteriales bacterium]|jgi:hypothetical protein|nr:hypothetical protein [Coriobacteriales bacterium]